MADENTTPADTPTDQASVETPQAQPEVQPEATPEQPSATPEAAPAQPEAPPERVVPTAEGYKAPDYVTPQMREFAHKNGFTQDQFDRTLKQFGTMLSATDKVAKTNLQAAGKQQIKDWGGEAQANLTLARRGLQTIDPDGSLTKILNESGYGNAPEVLKALHVVGQKMKEGGFLKSAVNATPSKSRDMAHRLYPNNVPQ